MTNLRSIGALVFVCLVATTPLAVGQNSSNSIPAGNALDLKLEALNEKYAVYMEHSRIDHAPDTISFWVLQVIPPSIGNYSAWSGMSINCATRQASQTEKLAVRDDDSVVGLFGEFQDFRPITPDSMDESLFQIVCEDKSFNFDVPKVSSVAAAAAQGRAKLKDRFGVE